MRPQHPCLLFILLAFSLAACNPASDGQPASAQGLELQIAVQHVRPTTKPEVSVTSNAVISADSEAESAVSPDTPPRTCPVTRPSDPPFTPPVPYPESNPWEFRYGSADLWTAVPQDGLWAGLPHNPEGYTQKVFWWREGYSWSDEPEPELVVTGRRLDDSAPPLNVSRATNAFASDIGSAMLVGVDFPTLGCWEITGSYGGHDLSFIVWVGP